MLWPLQQISLKLKAALSTTIIKTPNDGLTVRRMALRKIYRI